MIPRGKGYRILVVAVMMVWLSSLQEVCAGTLMPWSEAREVVREAYRMHGEGKAYEDSVSLAQAYTELKKWKYLFPTDFVRACYYYGRWLRAHENPVNAMQVLLAATHVRTNDYIILGRVYSNIGTMCHSAAAYELSYDMYQRSAEYFLQAGDTTLYYYGLNNLAVETAEQQDVQRTRMLLDSIRHGGIDEVCLKTRETEAILYLYTQQNDSVLVATDYLHAHGYHHIFINLMKAIAFSRTGKKDSALYYANHVTSNTTNPVHLISTYYILSHRDENISNDSILTLTSKRADAQKAWTVIERNLAQAMQLLQEDLNRKPDLTWLYAVIGTILILSIGLSIYIVNRKRKNALLAQQIKRQKQEHEDLYAVRVAHIEQECLLLGQLQDLYEGLSWRNYEQMCTIVNSRLYNIVDKLMPLHLSEREVRLCILELLNYSNAQMAIYLTYAQSGIGKLKNTTAKKLGTDGRNMRTFLISYIAK